MGAPAILAESCRCIRAIYLHLGSLAIAAYLARCHRVPRGGAMGVAHAPALQHGSDKLDDASVAACQFLLHRASVLVVLVLWPRAKARLRHRRSMLVLHESAMRDAGDLSDACARALVSTAGGVHVPAGSHAAGRSTIGGFGDVGATGFRLFGFCLVLRRAVDFTCEPGAGHRRDVCLGAHLMLPSAA